MKNRFTYTTLAIMLTACSMQNTEEYINDGQNRIQVGCSAIDAQLSRGEFDITDTPDHDEDKTGFTEFFEDIALFGTSYKHNYSTNPSSDVDITNSDNYTLFLNNAHYSYSYYNKAYISFDPNAFWRPDAYHVFYAYAPRIEDANINTDLEVKLQATEYGIEGNPDYNFVYGRRALLYNNSDKSSPQHQFSGIEVFMSPQLATLRLRMEVSEELAGTVVVYGIKIKSYKEGFFNLHAGAWRIATDDDNIETMTRYFDEFIVPVEGTYSSDEEAFRLGHYYTFSLFPNLKSKNESVTESTLNIIKEIQICINNKWYSAENIQYTGPNSESGSKIPLVPGYITSGCLKISSVATNEYNKLLVTFSNWKDGEKLDGTLH